MSDYIQINNEKAEALICALENSCKPHGPTDNLKEMISITIAGDECKVVYDDQSHSIDKFINPFFSQYFNIDQWLYKVDDQEFLIIIKTTKIVGRSGYNNILVQYLVKIMCQSNPALNADNNLNGKISRMSDKQDIDKRLVEEIKMVLDNGEISENCIPISKDSLDISYRYNPK